MKTPFLTQAIVDARINRRALLGPRCISCALVAVAMFTMNPRAHSALEAPFTRVTTGPLANLAAQWTTPAWGDYDNDGWLDLFVANWTPGGKHGLFHNNHDGTFSRVTTGPINNDPSAQPFGVAWADYDNDGWLDLLVSSSSRNFQASRLYRNTGGGSFARMRAADIGSLATDVSHAFGIAWGDYDRDGYLDLFVANGPADIPQQDFLFHNERNGRFVRVENAVTRPTLATAHGAWADFNNDGTLQLFLAQISSENSLFCMDAKGDFVDKAASFGLVDGSSVGAVCGDYDNDGDLDLLVVNMGPDGTGGPISPNYFYRNNGDGTFERIIEGPIAEDQDHFVSGSWVDYDNDGWLDLFVTILGPGTYAQDGVYNRLYRNQGNGTFARVTTGALVTEPGPAGGAAWGDYDNDGFPDVCVTHGTIFSALPNALFRNNGNAHNWVKIKCAGTISNRSAIGAKVRVKAKIGGVERWQLRQIGCNQDWVTFNSLDAVIGLGDATVVDTIRVEWPSGRVQEVHNVPVKQTLTLVESTDLSLSVYSAGEYNLTLRGPRQQRYRVDASVNLVTWSPLASLTITNADGTASFTHTPAYDDPSLFFRAVPE